MTRLEAMAALFAGKKVSNDEMKPFPTKFFKMGGAKNEQVMYCDSVTQPDGVSTGLRIPDIGWYEWVEQLTVDKVSVGNSVASAAKAAAPALTDAQVSSIVSGTQSSLGFKS